MRITPYVSNILEQPKALESCLAALQRRESLAWFRSRLQNGTYRRVVLTGMGSSYFAAFPLYHRMLRLGYATCLLETSELIHIVPELIAPETLLIVISQSGQSGETIDLLERARQRADVLGVTNGEKSALAAHSQACIFLQAGDENTVSCKTYLNTLAALAVIGGDLCGGESGLAALAEAPSAVRAYLADWEAHIAALNDLMRGVDQMFLLGRGDSLAAAHTGALIIKEAARFQAESMSCAAFRHGPIEIVAPSVEVLVYAGSSPLHAVNRKLVQDIQQFGGRAHLIEPGAAPGLFSLPAVPDPALPLLEILPAQLVSVALAERAGREAGVFRFAAKVTQVQ